MTQDHLVVKFPIDPGLNCPLDLGEVTYHRSLVEQGRADLDLDDSIVTVGMLTDTVIVQQAMSIGKLNPFGNGVDPQAHNRTLQCYGLIQAAMVVEPRKMDQGRPRVTVLCSGGLDSAVLAGPTGPGPPSVCPFGTSVGTHGRTQLIEAARYSAVN